MLRGSMQTGGRSRNLTISIAAAFVITTSLLSIPRVSGADDAESANKSTPNLALTILTPRGSRGTTEQNQARICGLSGTGCPSRTAAFPSSTASSPAVEGIPTWHSSSDRPVDNGRPQRCTTSLRSNSGAVRRVGRAGRDPAADACRTFRLRDGAGLPQAHRRPARPGKKRTVAARPAAASPTFSPRGRSRRRNRPVGFSTIRSGAQNGLNAIRRHRPLMRATALRMQ